MKTNAITIGTSMLVAAVCVATAPRTNAQETPEQWNDHFRGSYEVPLGNYTGHSPFMQSKSTSMAKPAPNMAAHAAPNATAAPNAGAAPKTGYTSSAPEGGLVRMQKSAPAVAAVGDTFTYTLMTVAQADVGDVVITDMLPAGVSYVSSDPAAEVNGKTLVWKSASMARGETKTYKVTVKAEAEGEMMNCATVSAVPRVCMSTLIGKAQLDLTKTGPATASLNSNITYTVTVKNTGNIPAKNVVVSDAVPQGMSGQAVSVTIPELPPGAFRKLPVIFKATQRGNITNVATAESSNAAKVSAQSTTLVQQPGLKIEKTTKDTEILINRTATYTILVKNTGDTPLTGVMVNDNAAAGTTITEAVGGSINANVATWNIGELAAGATKELTVKVVSKQPGKFCNTATVTSAQMLRDSSQSCTEWRGVTGVLVEVVDDPDPIQVGETSTYTIRITNQSANGTVDDLSVKVLFSAEINPTTASNNGSISGKTVTFPTVPTLGPKASATFTIVGKGVSAGDARTKVQVTTRMRQNPIEQTESTTVY
jgi:uncharacterized repeat protein (TIGR01451 family)